jgi:D-3-phosphoglycerate dehydrogenase
MKTTIIEPIGVSVDILISIIKLYNLNTSDFTFYNERANSDEELISRIGSSEVIIMANQPLSAKVIQNCPNLKLISVAFTGIDHIAIDVCREKNIMVCNSAGYSTNAVSELVFGMLFNFIRDISYNDTRTRKLEGRNGYVGSELFGKTFGVIGTGEIGAKTAKLALAFGCKILAYSRTEKEELKSLGVKFVELDNLLKESDFVSLHIPANTETKHLLNKEKLELLKNSAILINTARGSVVDEDALADILHKNKIKGALLDVYNVEPPLAGNSQILQAPNTVLLPHIAYATHEALEHRAKIVIENIRNFIEKTPSNRQI